MATRRLSELGIPANGIGIEGILKAAIDSVEDGGTIVFDAVRSSGNNLLEYALFAPLYISKSIQIVGESPGIRIVNRSRQGAIFNFTPTADNVFFGLHNLTFVSGTAGVSISGSSVLAPNSTLYNLSFLHQTQRALNIQVPELNVHLENVWIQGSSNYGIYLESNTLHDYMSINRCKVDGASVAGIYYKKAALGSGSVYISETEFLNNSQAIVVDNVRYYEHNVEFISNNANVVLSGTSQRLTASGGGGGSGVSVHADLTGLSVDDHKIYLHVSGTRNMSGHLNMGAFNITNVGTVDGIDVSTTAATIDAHILDVANPHATSLANIDPGTLSQLNTAISDANVVSEAQFFPHSASMISASGTFRTELDTLIAASGTYRAELTPLSSTVIRLDFASGAFAVISSSYKSLSASYEKTSSSWYAFSSSYVPAGASPVSMSVAMGFSGTVGGNYYTMHPGQGRLSGSQTFTAIVVGTYGYVTELLTKRIFGAYNGLNNGGWSIHHNGNRPRYTFTSGSGVYILENFVGLGWEDKPLCSGKAFHLGYSFDGTTLTLYWQGQEAASLTPGLPNHFSPDIFAEPAIGIESNGGGWGSPFDGGFNGCLYASATALTGRQMYEHYFSCSRIGHIISGSFGFTNMWTMQGETTAPSSLSDRIGSLPFSLTGALAVYQLTNPQWG